MNFQHCFKTAFCASTVLSWGNIYSSNKFLFVVFFSVFESIVFGLLAYDFFCKVVATAFCLSRKKNWGLFPIGKTLCLFLLRTVKKMIYRSCFQKGPQIFGETFCEFRQKYRSSVVETSFYLSRGTFLVHLKIYPKNNNISIFSVFWEKYGSTFVSKQPCTFPEDYFENFFWNVLVLWFFWDFHRKSFSPWSIQKFGHLVRTALHVSADHSREVIFSGKNWSFKFFSHIERTKFQISAKFSR